MLARKKDPVRFVTVASKNANFKYWCYYAITKIY